MELWVVQIVEIREKNLNGQMNFFRSHSEKGDLWKIEMGLFYMK
jgi:hypothetical protein